MVTEVCQQICQLIIFSNVYSIFMFVVHLSDTSHICDTCFRSKEKEFIINVNVAL